MGNGDGYTKQLQHEVNEIVGITFGTVATCVVNNQIRENDAVFNAALIVQTV
jgi:hypothetical protein